MPSAAIHQSISKIINKKLKLNEDLFFLGSIAPDCWRHSKFHGDKKTSHFSVICLLNDMISKKENYKLFSEKYKKHLGNPFVLGYLGHLITDTYWRFNVTSKYEYIENGQEVVRKLDGSLFVGNEYSRKMFLHENNVIIGINLTTYYKLPKLKMLDELPLIKNVIDELDISGLNVTINYVNDINFKNTTKENEIYKMNEIYNDVENCAQYVLKEIEQIKKNMLVI